MDKKFIIAIVIILILVIVLSYILFIKPQFEQYIINQRVRSQQQLINTIIQLVEENGFIVFNNTGEPLVLVEYQEEE